MTLVDWLTVAGDSIFRKRCRADIPACHLGRWAFAAINRPIAIGGSVLFHFSLCNLRARSSILWTRSLGC